MCGRNEAVNIVSVEGAKLSACSACSRHGKILFRLGGEGAVRLPATQMQTGEEELVDDYARRIHHSREKAGLTRLQLGQKIGERENYLEAIEQGRVRPTLATVKKLEKFLGIKLMEKEPERGVGELSVQKGGGVTLGDLLANPKKDKVKK